MLWVNVDSKKKTYTIHVESCSYIPFAQPTIPSVKKGINYDEVGGSWNQESNNDWLTIELKYKLDYPYHSQRFCSCEGYCNECGQKRNLNQWGFCKECALGEMT